MPISWENVSLQTRRGAAKWRMFGTLFLSSRHSLDQAYPNRWIWRGSLFPWPARWAYNPRNHSYSYMKSNSQHFKSWNRNSRLKYTSLDKFLHRRNVYKDFCVSHFTGYCVLRYTLFYNCKCPKLITTVIFDLWLINCLHQKYVKFLEARKNSVCFEALIK